MRRIFPISVLLVTLVMTLAHAFLAIDDLSSGLPVLISVFTVAESYPRRRSIPPALFTGAAFLGLMIAAGAIPVGLGSVIQTELAVLAAWTLGTWARERQAYIGTV